MADDELDEVEREYVAAIKRARDTPEAFELSIGLQEYRAIFKARSGFPDKRGTR